MVKSIKKSVYMSKNESLCFIAEIDSTLFKKRNYIFDVLWDI